MTQAPTNEAVKALMFIPVPSDRNEWIHILMSAKAAGISDDEAMQWSAQGSGYNPKEDLKQYQSLKPEGGITERTLFYEAYKHGYRPEQGQNTQQPAAAFHDPEQGQKADMIRYLEALFDPSEYVTYCFDSYKSGDKYRPNKRASGRTAGELIEALKRPGSKIETIFGRYDHQAGAWICINPTDGKGGKKENITAYRHILIESDDIPIKEQRRILEELKLPIAAVTYSGYRSIHALVRVNASSEEEYKARFNYLRDVLDSYGFSTDEKNNDQSRLSRMPGVLRGEKWQELKAVNTGLSSWEEWLEWYESSEADDLPEVESFEKYRTEPLPPLPEPIISGVLRRGRKMMITGSSKMGKSYLIAGLAVSIAEGAEWLGFSTKPGKVLYVNLEISKESFVKRLMTIYETLGIPQESRHYDRLHTWDLRGKAKPLDKLLPALLNRIRRNNGYDLVIIDPIYKIITGDENTASDMGYFCNLFDRICEQGSSVVYVHHHSKGTQANKSSMDRGAGSGVFARDADALLDFTRIYTDKLDDPETKDMKAYRGEFTLREFPAADPVNVWFDFPMFRVDNETLSDLPLIGSRKAQSNDALDRSDKKTERDERKMSLDIAFENCKDDNGLAELKDIAKFSGKTEKTIRRHVREFEYEYFISKGLVGKRNSYPEIDTKNAGFSEM